MKKDFEKQVDFKAVGNILERMQNNLKGFICTISNLSLLLKEDAEYKKIQVGKKYMLRNYEEKGMKVIILEIDNNYLWVDFETEREFDAYEGSFDFNEVEKVTSREIILKKSK